MPRGVCPRAAGVTTDRPPTHEELAAERALQPRPSADSSSSLGSALARFLYPKPARRTIGGIFSWWERRRLAFTAMISAGGAVSLGSHGLLTWLEGGAIEFPPLFGVLGMLALANACYTLGPLTEAALHRIWGRDVLPVGPHLFRAGLALSFGIAFLLPMLGVGARLALLVVRTLLGGG